MARILLLATLPQNSFLPFFSVQTSLLVLSYFLIFIHFQQRNHDCCQNNAYHGNQHSFRHILRSHSESCEQIVKSRNPYCERKQFDRYCEYTMHNPIMPILYCTGCKRCCKPYKNRRQNHHKQRTYYLHRHSSSESYGCFALKYHSFCWPYNYSTV